jgi:segregation and condensation protein B
MRRLCLSHGRGPLARRDPRQLPKDHDLPRIYRQTLEGKKEAGVGGPLARDAQLAQVEAVLLVADEPLPARKLAQAAGLADAALARRLVRKLQNYYDKDGTAFQVEELAGGYQLLTRAPYHRWLNTLRRDLIKTATADRLADLRITPAARETLAIIAYRQPIMRADIESIRGVHCAETLRLLMEKGLVRMAGRHDSLGRPVLYGTTRKFLQIFGLKSLKDLPQAAEINPAKTSGGEGPGV